MGDVCEEITVGFVGPMTAEYREAGVPFLRSMNIEPFRINKTDLKYVSPEFHAKIKKSRLRAGDVVIVRTGDPGTAAVVPEWMHDGNCSDLVIARPGPGVDAQFLCYYVNAVSHHIVNEHVVGAVQQHFNVGSAKELKLPLPALPEQRAIARVLGGLDGKIELNRRMNQTLEDLARGLFRSWFVEFDLVTKNGNAKSSAVPASLFPKRLVDSPLGPIPEGWRVGSVADLARYVNGRNFTKNATGIGRMVVRIAELNSGPGGSTVYNDVKAEPENVVQPGDLLFAWSGSLDVYRWNRDEALVNQHIFKVVCEAYPQWFVHFHLCEAMPFFQGIAADKATTMGHIKREHLRQAELALPPEPVLKYATQHIAPIYARLLANERESLRLAATRDALLPQLLSGEVRLAGASKSVEEVVA